MLNYNSCKELQFKKMMISELEFGMSNDLFDLHNSSIDLEDYFGEKQQEKEIIS